MESGDNQTYKTNEITQNTRIVVDTPDINFKGPVLKSALAVTLLANVPRLYGLLTRDDYTALMPNWYQTNIPDALNPIYHVGNTGMTAALIGHALYTYWNSQAKVSKEETFGQFAHSIYRTRNYAIVGALSLNAVAELVGYFGKSTPDIADFAWGALGGYLGYKIVKPRGYLSDNGLSSGKNQNNPDKAVNKSGREPITPKNKPPIKKRKKNSHHHRRSSKK